VERQIISAPPSPTISNLTHPLYLFVYARNRQQHKNHLHPRRVASSLHLAYLYLSRSASQHDRASSRDLAIACGAQRDG
jgi:hypothetical protein